MLSSNSRIKRVRAAAIDGRTSNWRFVQSQLKVLHQSLLDSREEILDVVASTPFTTEAEAEVEYYMTIATVSEHYDGINFDQAIDDEYKIARGENNIERRVGYGVVVVRPTSHTRFYSIISAVACAIAAGNTFVVECDECAVDGLLPSLFQSLDEELYALSKGPLNDKEVLSTALIIDQTGKKEAANLIRSLPCLRSIAVVDRTADVDKAAEQILSAHLAFSGQSPHAPDLIILNEWVKNTFIDTIIRKTMGLNRDKDLRHIDIKDIEEGKLIEEAESKDEATLIKGEGFYIIDVHQRSSSLATMRGNGQCLTLLTVASLSDAVIAASNTPEYLVAYHFAEPAAGKFLSQQIDSCWSFVNCIPAELLVGPALPHRQDGLSLRLRYTKEMMSKPRPELIESIESFGFELKDFTNPTSSKLQAFRERESQPLRETGQGPGTAIGFFEQGIIVGALFIVLPVISLVGYSGWRILWHFAGGASEL
ncbi:uncharacterized protein BO88DRAFT_454647 [Aspergillus vadensis CBS 113365]|uniref:Aldehyde dehydrogenase PutA n=1 Tax=Aspergillus vadensis (strain CBS 113365 / IMI 142717 / IBT 24658) TaxID=1448311 RepID=A0A319BCE6_ASPVC|nr:hypothetical protein BO88DRAFT_454647 [Aspergillus vadensis CBS 113365]PYH68360.1 hypothetical protein BO88DRAFT_454647 [Aspergillus vadensis CBS 113365]